jgi:transcriptional repressor NrdR
MKRDGKRESFDRSKLLRGMVRACEKTGLSATDLESIIGEIEAELQQRSQREIPTQEIGELVLQRLKSLSEVAYVRFASVYRQFQGIRDFAEALNHFETDQDNVQGVELAPEAEDSNYTCEDSSIEASSSLCSAS